MDHQIIATLSLTSFDGNAEWDGHVWEELYHFLDQLRRHLTNPNYYYLINNQIVNVLPLVDPETTFQISVTTTHGYCLGLFSMFDAYLLAIYMGSANGWCVANQVPEWARQQHVEVFCRAPLCTFQSQHGALAVRTHRNLTTFDLRIGELRRSLRYICNSNNSDDLVAVEKGAHTMIVLLAEAARTKTIANCIATSAEVAHRGYPVYLVDFGVYLQSWDKLSQETHTALGTNTEPGNGTLFYQLGIDSLPRIGQTMGVIKAFSLKKNKFKTSFLEVLELKVSQKNNSSSNLNIAISGRGKYCVQVIVHSDTGSRGRGRSRQGHGAQSSSSGEGMKISFTSENTLIVVNFMDRINFDIGGSDWDKYITDSFMNLDVLKTTGNGYDVEMHYGIIHQAVQANLTISLCARPRNQSITVKHGTIVATNCDSGYSRTLAMIEDPQAFSRPFEKLELRRSLIAVSGQFVAIDINLVIENDITGIQSLFKSKMRFEVDDGVFRQGILMEANAIWAVRIDWL